VGKLFSITFYIHSGTECSLTRNITLQHGHYLSILKRWHLLKLKTGTTEFVYQIYIRSLSKFAPTSSHISVIHQRFSVPHLLSFSHHLADFHPYWSRYRVIWKRDPIVAPSNPACNCSRGTIFTSITTKYPQKSFILNSLYMYRYLLMFDNCLKDWWWKVSSQVLN